MVEWIVIFSLVVWLVLTFFYKQALYEFRVNQLEWQSSWHTSAVTQWTSPLTDVLSERVPVVIRSVPRTKAWSREDIALRDAYQQFPLFKETTLPQWLATADATAICPWGEQDAERIAAITGLSIWFQTSGMESAFLHQPFLRAWLGRPVFRAWAGAVGMHKTTAIWTVIQPIDGTVTVSILPQTMEARLPHGWRGRFPADLTRRDTPFVDDLRFMDIIVRPGTVFVMPPHWIVAWMRVGTDSISTVCTVEFHSPISCLASR